MVVVVFRCRPKADIGQDYMTLAMRMSELASKMPGHIAHKSFAAEDGEWVTIVEFASEAELRAWREHPEHIVAQQKGREQYYSEYQIQVCNVVRESKYKAAEPVAAGG
jgi:heme-degrading monooxygenase HmoA